MKGISSASQIGNRPRAPLPRMKVASKCGAPGHLFAFSTAIPAIASPGSRSSWCLQYRTRLALGIHRHIGEEPHGHLDLFLAAAAPVPAPDLHRDRGATDLDDVDVAAHFIADEDRTMKR